MNDLQLLGTLLAADEPAQHVVERSRHRLQNRILNGPPRRRRTGWLAGLAVTAAATAVVVVIASTPAAPNSPPIAAPPVVTQPAVTLSAQQVLLAAATAAASSPDGSGTYWYLKITDSYGVYEYWTKPDGEAWFKAEKTGGKALKDVHPRPNPFSLVAAELTLEQLRSLPTDPVALKAWIVEATEHTKARTSAGPFTAEDKAMAVFQSLISLVSTLPAPPEVRAAAFRTIAAYPDVKTLGAVPGGQGLQVPPYGERLVVDPATGRVNETSTYITPDGAAVYSNGSGTTKIDGKWTDVLPG